MKTKAAVLYEVGKAWEVTELDLDPPRTGEVLIRFVASGLCHSDEHIRATGTARLPLVGVLAGAFASILPYSYAGTMGLVQRNASHAFFHALGASRLDRTICSPAKDAGWKAVMGETLAPHPDEVLKSDLAILWGINAVATSVHFAQRAREARRAAERDFDVGTIRGEFERLLASFAAPGEEA
mgnify:CR=1 FL=1